MSFEFKLMVETPGRGGQEKVYLPFRMQVDEISEAAADQVLDGLIDLVSQLIDGASIAGGFYQIEEAGDEQADAG